MAEWIIDLKPDDSVDRVTRAGRSFMYDLDDEVEALRSIRRSRKFAPGDTIKVREHDGYTRRVSLP